MYRSRLSPGNGDMKILKRVRAKIKEFKLRLKAYFKRLLFPLYLFPVKLITYSIYYILKFLISLAFSLIKIIIECIIFPFRSLKNFLKSLFILGLLFYIPVSLFVSADYLRNQYGYIGKIFCSYGTYDKLQNDVVRIVGGNSEGSGFFISDDQVLTNFHVIDNEPSPKIIFPDGTFITPNKIVGDKDIDLAVLSTEKKYPNFVLPLPQSTEIYGNEPLLSTGYPLGTELTGRATTVRGNFINLRHSSKDKAYFIQTNISLVGGMSGGPLTDQCGNVKGINTLSLAGLSLFIDAGQAGYVIPSFTDDQITKVNLNPSASPEESVKAFYTYLKTRRMKDGFDLLSQDYLKKTNFQEWTNRFYDVLDVEVYLTKPYQNSSDTIYIKFSTKNWTGEEVNMHYYEGTWQTIFEDNKYKMLSSNIKEVPNPSWDWYYQ